MVGTYVKWEIHGRFGPSADLEMTDQTLRN
jgi:hypothetical protein